jgi:trimethylamine:corrinoid methyltransferase-like protein
MRKLGHRADYLGQVHTAKWFSEEQYIPSDVIDRGSFESWRRKGGTTAWERAQDRVEKLLVEYEPPSLADGLRRELRTITLRAAQKFGMDELPPLPED